MSRFHLCIRNYALCYFTHVHEKESECQNPPQIVPREVQPCIVVNLDFGALASPANEQNWKSDKKQEDMGNQVEGIHKADISKDTSSDVVC